MRGNFRTINSDESLNDAINEIIELYKKDKYGQVGLYFGKRTLSQNALKSVWYSDIAKYRGDVTAKDVERECKLEFGVPILRRRELFNWKYERTLDKLPYEKQLIFIGVEKVTSEMTVKELSEYCDEMQNKYQWLQVKR